MKIASLSSISAIALASVFFSPGDTPASAKDLPKTSNRLALTIRSVPEVPIPQSVFTGEGRNPFYPQSTIRVFVPQVALNQKPTESYTFILNGITSPPKRTAMINGQTFEPGEEAEVHLPSGARILIKCEEIKSDSALISFGGQKRVLKLRSGL